VRPSKRNRQKGGTALETLLTLIAFLALFFGIFDVGTILFVHQTLTDRARNAARWGAVNAYDPTSIQNLVLYGTTAAGATTAFGLAAANVTVSRPATNIGQPEDRIIVTVVYPVHLVSVLLGQSATWSGGSVPTWNLRIQISTPYEVPT
jgi:Flp pilus assembly protein TadG